MRLFGSESLMGIMDKLGMDDEVPIENAMVSKALENAQRRVEARNFDMRKSVLEYDDVMNEQRASFMPSAARSWKARICGA